MVVYKHIRLDNEQVFYIGIGREDRPYSKCGRNKDWWYVVDNFGYRVEVIESDLSKVEAVERERYYIKYYGRLDNNSGILVNKNNGGQGAEYGDKNPMRKYKHLRDDASKRMMGKVKPETCKSIIYEGIKYTSLKELYLDRFTEVFSSYKSFHRSYKSRGIENILDKSKKGNQKSVINLQNGVVFNTAKEAYETFNIGCSISYFRSMLNGSKNNKTDFRYV